MKPRKQFMKHKIKKKINEKVKIDQKRPILTKISFIFKFTWLYFFYKKLGESATFLNGEWAPTDCSWEYEKLLILFNEGTKGEQKGN